MEDTSFIDQLIQGDEGAWGKFYESATGEICATLKSEYNGISIQDIEDITQDVFLSLLDDDRAALRSFRQDCTLNTFIKMIARNAASDLLGSAPRRREIPVGGSMELAAIEEMNHVRQRV